MHSPAAESELTRWNGAQSREETYSINPKGSAAERRIDGIETPTRHCWPNSWDCACSQWRRPHFRCSFKCRPAASQLSVCLSVCRASKRPGFPSFASLLDIGLGWSQSSSCGADWKNSVVVWGQMHHASSSWTDWSSHSLRFMLYSATMR
jgi:hypothetical protein